MRNRDWTFPVLLTATTCIVVTLTVLLSTRWIVEGIWDRDPGPGRERRLPPPQIPAWIGEVGGLKAVLTPIWGDPKPDELHDESLNKSLSLPGDRGFSYFRLLLFNTSDEARTVVLGDGALSVASPGSAGPARSKDLRALLERGEVKADERSRAILGALGALHSTVTVPPGREAPLVVAFDRRVDLGDASEVRTQDGTAFRRRPMLRAELQALLYDPPDQKRLEDL